MSRVVFAAVIVGGLSLSSICLGYSGGSGTAEDPYKIATAADLNDIDNHPEDSNKHFILVNDVNLAGYINNEYNVICGNRSGSWYTMFEGVFDGNGHSISNLKLDVNESMIGLFGYVGSNGIVKNICLERIDLKGIHYVGGVAGRNEGVIENCHISEGIIEGDQACGGITGASFGPLPNNISEIRNSSFRGRVKGTWGTGGIVGATDGPEIVKCYAIVEIIGEVQCGGIVGNNMGGNLKMCFSKGTITCSHSAGGLTGITSDHCRIGGDINDCYADVTVNCSRTAGGFSGSWPGLEGQIRNCYCSGEVVYDVNNYEDVGGFIGEEREPEGVFSSYFLESSGPDNGFGEPLTDEEMKQQESFAGWDFAGEVINGPNDIWKICEGESYPQLWYEKYGGGSGDANNPYLIYTSCQMNAIGADANDWGKRFKLMADIDLGGYSGTEFNIIGKYIGYHDPCNRPFAGVFDGNGHTISNFTYSTDENDVGIFAYVAVDAAIKDLGLIEPNITAGDRVGSLVAWHDNGTITNCYVQSGIVSGGTTVGGLIGGSRNNVFRCYSTATVIGESAVGGLAGVTSGYAAVLVPPYHPDDPAKITDCYSSGEVSGDVGVGGLVGWNYVRYVGWGDYVPAKITNCYAAGAVSGNSYVGGLIGRSNGDVNNCFWDVNSSGQASSAGGTGKTTAEMKTLSTFTSAGWDFVGEVINGPNDIWDICEGTNYPKLAWQISLTGDFICPDGVEMKDLAILCEEWLLEEIPADVWPDGGDGIVNFFDWAVFANQWQITADFETLADFAEQWLKTGVRYCIADIAPAGGGDGIVNMPDFAAFANNWLEGIE